MRFKKKVQHHYEVIIIGAGITGLCAALHCNPLYKCALISKVHPLRSHSCAAQGGITAALGNCETDFNEWHIYDTLKGGDGLSDYDAVEYLCTHAAATLHFLDDIGVPFSRTTNGLINQRLFGAHTAQFGKNSVRRACFVEDRTGSAILTTLWDKCQQHTNLFFYNEFFLLSFLIAQGSCNGVIAWDIIQGCIHIFYAKAVLIATGGCGRIFSPTTNSFSNTADAHAILLRKGACLQDMEFIQFHPTALQGKGILISEAARSEGAYLINDDSIRFMDFYAPQLKELASRDIVARAIQSELRRKIKKQRHNQGNQVYLDLRHIPKEHIDQTLPQIVEITKKQAHINIYQEILPVEPAAHYTMGGIPINVTGEVLWDGMTQSINGLYAAGECSCASVHGANRLGGNSLLEAALFGKHIAESINTYVATNPLLVPAEFTAEITAIEHTISSYFSPTTKEYNLAFIRKSLQKEMNRTCGVFRTHESLSEMLQYIDQLKELYAKLSLFDCSLTFNQNLIEILELSGLLEVSKAVVFAALHRKESRGSHWREDFTAKNDETYQKHSLVHSINNNLHIRYKDICFSKENK